jgi:hypothetical protein
MVFQILQIVHNHIYLACLVHIGNIVLPHSLGSSISVRISPKYFKAIQRQRLESNVRRSDIILMDGVEGKNQEVINLN